MRCRLIVWLACCLASLPARADDDFVPGLLGRYVQGDLSLERIDARPIIEWSAGSPDERLPPGTIELTWQGQLLIQAEEHYQLHVHALGHVQVLLDGEVLLETTLTETGWCSSPPVPLGFGFRELEIRYRSSESTGRCGVYWSGETFPLEPLPHQLLFLPKPRPDLVEIARGRRLFESLRCGRCHREPDEPELPEAPPLFHVTTGIQHGWFAEKLRGQRHVAPPEGNSSVENPASPHLGRMPDFGLNDDEVESLVAWLWHMSQPTNTVAVPNAQPDRAGIPSGEELFHSVGCLGCHQFQGLGTTAPWDGGDLTSIGRKRSAEFLATWLQQPTRLNPQTQMPVIALTPTERARIVEFLVDSAETRGLEFEGRDLRPQPDRRLVEQGRELSHALRCVNCHNIPAQLPNREGLPSLVRSPHEAVAVDDDTDRSCLAPLPDPHGPAEPPHRPRRPDYSGLLSARDREALSAYLASRTTRFAPLSQFERGRRLLEDRNCLGCHDREGSRGLSAWAGRISLAVTDLQNRSQLLVPPHLTAVGDKLRDDVLERAVSGKLEDRHLPWLSVRMPRFEHSREELSAITHYLVHDDRIPDGAPNSLRPAGQTAGLTGEELDLVGRSLIGAGGFSCIACHQVGEYVPQNVALGTRGSDLLGLRNRMRPEFFLRWCRSPLRIVPGMEMPSYQHPVPGVLDESLELQMTALWRALENPEFVAPTNPTAVEQLLTVTAGEPPRVLRDVFTVNPADGGGYVARSVAVGFENGHALLFDLDRLAVRGWTWGDFARQRAEGKSWFWDLAGSPVASGLIDHCELNFAPAGSDNENTGIEPHRDETRQARLKSYSADETTLSLYLELDLELDGILQTLTLQQDWQAWQALEDPSWQGVHRRLTLSSLPGDLVPKLSLPEAAPLRGEARIQAGSWSSSGEGTWSCEVIYAARIQAPRLAPPAVEPILPREEPVLSLPGYVGRRLPIPVSIMPTSLAVWNGHLVVTSLKGQIYLLQDADRDGLPETITLFEEGLAAPFGVLPDGDSLLVVHKAELLRLTDLTGDRRCNRREVVADGWGYTYDYHDWVTGPVRDSAGRLYLGLGSDYSQDNRPPNTSRWRGKVLRLEGDGSLTPLAHELRYPIGIAFDSRERLFVTDQQGVQNTFNELNLIQPGARYGVPGKTDPPAMEPAMPAAIQIPHPWTRSVNGLFFLPEGLAASPFGGHAIGCEYNADFLVRMSLQEVAGELQGACYEFSRATWTDRVSGLSGPVCGLALDTGELYIGGFQDSGWLGGLNQGEIIRFEPVVEEQPNGIHEIRVTAGGFEVDFLKPVDASSALNRESYSLSGYTRVWTGSYATEDSGRYAPAIEEVTLSEDGRTVHLKCGPLREGYVYDLSCGGVLDAAGGALFPGIGYYTVNRLPEE